MKEERRGCGVGGVVCVVGGWVGEGWGWGGAVQISADDIVRQSLKLKM